jgi:glycosyltransferase involved in cell wall biosynthesis
MYRVAITGRANSFSNGYGQGIERYKYEITRRLISNYTDDILVQKNELKPLPLNIQNRSASALLFLMGALFSRFQGYSIVHNLEQMPLISPLKGQNVKTIQTLYDFQAVDNPASLETKKSFVAHSRMALFVQLARVQNFYKDKCDHFIAISSTTRDSAVKHGFDPRKITVINLGIDERFSSHKNRFPNTKTVGYVGSFSINKNLLFALKSFEKIKDENIEFKIWGKGQSFDIYKNLDPSLRFDSRIKFMGFAPENKIVDIYDEFQVLVFPSLVEGFGIPVLEAQSRGIPVIILKNSILPPEVRKYSIEVNDYTEMSEAVTEIMNGSFSDTKRKEMINYSRSFTWDLVAKKTFDLYSKLLELN